MNRALLLVLALLPSVAFASPVGRSPAYDATGEFSGGTVTAPILFSPDNTHDLGSASFRVRSAYIGTSIVLGAAGPKISAPADGEVLISNNAGTGFSKLWLGTTSLYSIETSVNDFYFRRAGSTAYANGRFEQIWAYSGTNPLMVMAANVPGLLMSSGGSVGWGNSATSTSGTDSGLDRLSAGVVQITNGSTGTGKLLFAHSTATIAADDTTPDVSAANVFVTSANSGATAITDLDNPTVGQVVRLCGGSSTNASTLADSGNFNLTGAFTLNLDDCITLYVQADNDYVELDRSDN